MTNKLPDATGSSGSSLVRVTRTLALVLVPFILYLYQSWHLHGWIIDDAGISFAYARSLGFGYGLVTQPGMPPVEGFSNFLWVVILAPLFRLHLFDPYVTPKIVSALLVLASFYFIARTIEQWPGKSKVISVITLLAIAMNSPFVIWTCSGLENALLCMLVAFLLYAVSVDSLWIRPYRTGLLVGCAIAALGMTRPDGIIYALTIPALILFRGLLSGPERRVSAWKGIATSIVAFGALFGGFLLFRHSYFGSWYPNTYAVKGGPDTDIMMKLVTMNPDAILKTRLLFAGLWGEGYWLFGAAFVVAAVAAGIRYWRERPGLVFTGYLCCLAAAAHLLLPDDWMREFRFGTPFFMLVYVCCAVVAGLLLERAGRVRMLLVVAGAAGLLWLNTTVQNDRLIEFCKWPTVSFARIAEQYSTKYDSLATQLAISNASVLMPDIGATLYYSKCRVYDLAGLCDTTIAKTRLIDQPKYWDYVFDTMRPTFIHTHGFFSAVSKFERDPRFTRDYVGLECSKEWYAGDSVLVGDWVRRDQIVGRDSVVARLQNKTQ